jgi:hypothetical protein
MMQLENISASLAELTALNRKGVEALFTAEQELAEAEHELDLVEARAFFPLMGRSLNGRRRRSWKQRRHVWRVTLPVLVLVVSK